MKITVAVAHATEADFMRDEIKIDEPRKDEILVRVVGGGL
jgi:aryl-alcohol dehydrogenase|tara:strand:+ start:44548 stop:44667 length:120 start_codon:yes stop_codon:yes gene_type:complete